MSDRKYQILDDKGFIESITKDEVIWSEKVRITNEMMVLVMFLSFYLILGTVVSYLSFSSENYIIFALSFLALLNGVKGVYALFLEIKTIYMLTENELIFHNLFNKKEERYQLQYMDVVVFKNEKIGFDYNSSLNILEEEIFLQTTDVDDKFTKVKYIPNAFNLANILVENRNKAIKEYYDRNNA